MADRASLPKYLQISEYLIREIAAGRIRVGDRLPPERRMAEQMDTAVGTLRKALKQLEEQGVLERRHGSGNYVRNASQQASIYAFFRLERLTGGGLPRARVLSVDRQPKPDDLPSFGTGAEAHRIRRLRLLDDTIVAAEQIWLDADLSPDLDRATLPESLYLYYRERLGIWIARTEDRIGVGEMPDWGAETGCAPGAPCGLAVRISTTQDGRCPEISQTWFNHERARYVARSN